MRAHSSWLEIDLDAAASNLRVARRIVGENCKIFAVLKGNAYGFGTLEMARAFVESGADALALADLSHAIALREHGFTVPILLYPSTVPDAETAAEVIRHDITPTLITIDTAALYSRVARQPLSVFCKVDVGLQRLGISIDQAAKDIRKIAELRNLKLGGICTHLHVPVPTNKEYLKWQLGRFTNLVDELTRGGLPVPIRMAANSPLVLGFPESHCNAVDPGRMLYGVIEDTAHPLAGRIASIFKAFKTTLVAVKDVLPRERFSELAPFLVREPMRLGVLPIGLAEGFLSLNAGRVIIRGASVPILARPTLEHTRVDLTRVPEAQTGDEVVLIGQQGKEEIALTEVAVRHELGTYEIALAIRGRTARTYVSGQGIAAPAGR